jgi:hypothetical protein
MSVMMAIRNTLNYFCSELVMVFGRMKMGCVFQALWTFIATVDLFLSLNIVCKMLLLTSCSCNMNTEPGLRCDQMCVVPCTMFREYVHLLEISSSLRKLMQNFWCSLNLVLLRLRLMCTVQSFV